MMEGLDETFDAVLFVGYHAKAEAPRGLFAHTGSGVVRDLQVNGVSVGEGGMNAAMAAWYGVAVALVTGDDAAVEEVKAIGARRPHRGREARHQHPRRRAAAAGRGAPADRGRRASGGGGSEEAGARAQRALPGDDALPRHDDPRGGERVPRDGALVRPTRVSFARDTMPEAYRLIRVLYRYINTD